MSALRMVLGFLWEFLHRNHQLVLGWMFSHLHRHLRRTSHLPAPLPGLAPVAGIESITIDGTRHYFGFGFGGSSCVASPLIADADSMAAFASIYLLQTDGFHTRAYWRELVDGSVDESELSSEPGSRDFSSARMRQIAKQLQFARSENRATPGFAIEYHLIYLLHAACDWSELFTDPAVRAALERLGLNHEEQGWDCIHECIDLLAGRRPLPEAASAADAAMVVQQSLHDRVSKAAANWSEVFQPLIAQSPSAVA